MVAMGIVCRVAMERCDVICMVAIINCRVILMVVMVTRDIIKVGMGAVQLYAWVIFVLVCYVYGCYGDIWSFSFYGYPVYY